MNSKKIAQAPLCTKTSSKTHYKNTLITNTFYTDASKLDQNVGMSIIVTENTSTTYQLPPKYSIFTAETIAMYKAVQITMENKDTSHNNII